MEPGCNPIFRPSVFGGSLLCQNQPTHAPNKEASKSEVERETIKLAPAVINANIPRGPKPNTSSDSQTTAPTVDSTLPSNFVFGQNISERIANEDATIAKKASVFGEKLKEIDSTENVFTSLAKACHKDGSQSAASLNESAEVVQKSQAATLPQLDATQVSNTGEESEATVFQCSCRLFVCDKVKWNSLGSGHIHVNDPLPGSKEGESSRIIVRLGSTQRVKVNSPIFHEMSLDLADDRSIRLSVFEEGGAVKSYLLVCPISEARPLFDCLNERKQKASSAIQKSPSTGRRSTAPEPNKPSTTLQPALVFRQSALASHVKSLEASRPPVNPRKTTAPPTSDDDSTGKPEDEENKKRRKREEEREGPSTSNVIGDHASQSISRDVSEYVFGQNLQNRVANAPPGKGATGELWLGEGGSSTNPQQLFMQLAKRVTSQEQDTLFARRGAGESDAASSSAADPADPTDSSAAAAADHSTENGNGEAAGVINGETLQQSAARHQAERRSVLPMPEARCETGEEQEETVLRLYCRMYFLNKENKFWECRGNVYLHLNDSTEGKSRLVARMQKTHRLTLNSPIWESMRVEKASEKSLRCLIINSVPQEDGSAPNGEPLACLMMFKSPSEPDRLLESLRTRIDKLCSTHSEKEDAKEPAPEPAGLSE